MNKYSSPRRFIDLPGNWRWQLSLAALLAVSLLGQVRSQPDAVHVERLKLPPCPHCTKPQRVEYSSPESFPKVFWWYDGYRCTRPCID